MASAGSKRGRSAWEDCEEVDELKQHLCKQQQQIEKLQKEKSELTKALRGAEGQADDQTPEELRTQADMMRKSLQSNLLAQMVYRNKSNTSRISADIPNLSLSQVRLSLPKHYTVTFAGAWLCWNSDHDRILTQPYADLLTLATTSFVL